MACWCCGKTGKDSDDYGGQCQACYDETNRDWHDGPRYCGSCYHTLTVEDMAHEPDEVVGCRYCRSPLLVPIDQMEYNRRTDETRAAWTKAVRDGLIRP